MGVATHSVMEFNGLPHMGARICVFRNLNRMGFIQIRAGNFHVKTFGDILLGGGEAAAPVGDHNGREITPVAVFVGNNAVGVVGRGGFVIQIMVNSGVAN